MIKTGSKLFIFTAILLVNMTFVALFAHAQNAPQTQKQAKPKLIPIALDEKTNDKEALEIVRKLDPDFFNIDPELFGKNGQFFARYVDLDQNAKKRFVIVTALDAGFYCTAFGCPYYIYMNGGKNKWRLVLGFQGYSVYQDKNTDGDGPDNLISQTIGTAKNKTNIWLWNGQQYVEAKQK